MRTPAPGRRTVGIVTAFLLGTMSFAVVFVAGPASASTAATTTTTTSTTSTTSTLDPNANSPASHFFVINGTANAASDHEIVGSSAFPNYTTGAVDNYYSMAHAHVDNAPFAEGTASPFDTGPVGQTAAAGNFQQPQYADARWPGDSGKASYGSQGGPYATAEASELEATADASEASNGLSAPGAPSTFAAPKGFDGRLRAALAAWKAKWQSRLNPKKPAGTTPTPAPPSLPTVTTPIATVTTPAATLPGAKPTPPAPVPSLPAVPSASARDTSTPSRSMAVASGDGESLLESSTSSALDAKTKTLVTSGESRLGRVSLGGGQIVIEGIHVSASITNDGTPTNKVAVSVASASIGGVPVTIDQDGVHVAGQGQGLPYQQASDSLNGALKQAGIQLFIVSPEITTSSCDQAATATTTNTPTSCDQTGMCDQGGGSSSGGQTGTTGTTTSPTTTTTNGTGMSTTSSSCDQSSTGSSCGQTGTSTTPTTSDQTGTTSTPSWCDLTGPSTSSAACAQAGTTTTPTTTDQTTSTTTPTSTDGTGTTGSSDQAGLNTEETVTATGVHLVFTQPVSQSGVPAQFAEHILGEVFLDSLAVPAGALPDLNLDLGSSCSTTGSHVGGGKKKPGGASRGGGSAAGGSMSSSSSSPSSQPGASFAGGGASLPGSSSPGSAGQTTPASFVSTLKKPLWLLVAYLVWQALTIGTGASVWHWRKGGAS